MKQPPKIIIMGATGSGKTALANIITKALDEYGICGVVIDTFDGYQDTSCYDFKNPAKALAGKAVIIETVQINRMAC